MKIKLSMKNLLVILILAFGIIVSELHAQFPNENTTLLAQVDGHGEGYSALWGYTAPNGREYAILGCSTGTAFIDITDTTNIHEVDFVPGVPSNWREMKVHSTYAYVVSEGANSRLQIIALQYLPDSVSLVSTYSYNGYTNTHSISQSGPYLYLNGGDNTYISGNEPGGTTILDITNPVSPVKRGLWSTYYVHDCRVINDTMYSSNIFSGHISVINVANKDNPVTINSWVNNPNPFPHNTALAENHRYIYTTDETSSPAGVLKVWDKQNLNNVTLVTTWQPSNITNSIVHNVEIYGSLAVIAHYTAGIRVLNISNPTAPQEIAWYDTYPSTDGNFYAGCWGVYMFPASKKIIGSDMSGGLFVIKVNSKTIGILEEGSTAKLYSLQQNYPNPFNPATTIEYSLPKSEYVTIKIFDELGREAGIIVDEFKRGGNHKVSYDAGRLSSGIYFYSIQAGNYKETKRMTLIK